LALCPAQGGPPGFLKVLDNKILGCVDFRGNRPHITAGNIGANDWAALILMAYPNRRRLEIYAHARLENLARNPALRGVSHFRATRAKSCRPYCCVSRRLTGTARSTSRRALPKRSWRERSLGEAAH
jgi:hypothetical protein